MADDRISLEAVFDDLTSRFFINLPDEERATYERVFVQLQEAHWFYEGPKAWHAENFSKRSPFADFYSDRLSHLPKLSLKQFCQLFFKLRPELGGFSGWLNQHFDELHTKFRDYLG